MARFAIIFSLASGHCKLLKTHLTFQVLSFSSSNVNDLCFIERFKIFKCCVGSDEFVINSSIVSCACNSIKLHPLEVDPNVFGHF